MTWLNDEKLIQARSDLETVNSAIEHAKRTLHYLDSHKNHIERQIRYMEYRNRMERETNAKVVTTGEI